MKRSLRSLLAFALAFALAVGVALPAAGGCCDDFWSCAGAVATAGLSCAAQAALAALQGLIQHTVSVRDATTQNYEAQLQKALDDLRAQIAEVNAEIQRLTKQVETAVANGDKIFHEDQEGIRASLAAAKTHAALGTGGSAAASSASSVFSGSRIGPTPTPSSVSSTIVPQNPLAPGVKTPSPSSEKLRATEKTGGAAAPPASSTFAGSTPPGVPTPSSLAGSTFAGSSSMNAAALEALQADPSLGNLRQQLDVLKKEKDAILAKILKKEASIGALEMSSANAAADAARAAYAAQILAPITNVLGSLEAALTNPLNAGAVVTAAIALLDDVAKGIENVVLRFVGGVEQAGNASLAAAQPEVDELGSVAAEAQKILATMQKMTALRTALARQALARGVSGPVSTTPSALRKLKSSASLADRARTLGAGLATLKPQFQRFVATPGAVDVSPFRQRLAGDIDGLYRGKSSADARKVHANLLLEARRRFASDPKTLAAVEKVLNDDARARGIS